MTKKINCRVCQGYWWFADSTGVYCNKCKSKFQKESDHEHLAITQKSRGYGYKFKMIIEINASILDMMVY